jgi:UDP-N-acetylglucosamine--N-acetylmuramyl-(pentapeptide) pyrophosphoryl-undecaprenol N-acetylglucosamine transferase
VLRALSAKHADLDTLWVGGEAGMEAELVMREGISYKTIPAAGLHGVGPAAMPRNAWKLMRGTLASARFLDGFRPDVLFLTGGFLAGPMVMAARSPFARHRPRTMLFVPDIEPGLALKLLARFADRIAVTTSASQRYFSQEVIETGYPIRPDLQRWTKADARAALGLQENLPVLLVGGGSKGARSINEALIAHLPTLLEESQVVHLTGQAEADTVAARTRNLDSAVSARYHRFAYLHEQMGAALAAADLAVMRAGASVLGELTFFGLPAVLVPYPHAWRYQHVNAEYLADRNAAVVLEDTVLSEQLLPVVMQLLRDPSKREAMASAMRSLAHPEAAEALANQLLTLGKRPGGQLP